MFYKLCVAPAGLPATLDAHFTYVSSAQLTITSTSSLASPPPSPLPSCSPPISCGPGTFYNSITNQCETVMAFGSGTFYNSAANQCEIACGPSNGRRMATEVPLDAALCQVALDDALDDVQILGDRLRDVSSYLEEHPEDFASIRSEELRSRLKQLFGQPALA